MNHPFYDRPMVKRMQEIFDHPQKPASFDQRQFDDFQRELKALAAKEWHEIGQDDYWYYLLDLTYVDLDQGLFNYLFPAFLVHWWEGQLYRMGGPLAEDFYRAIDRGQILTKMMDMERRKKVLDWMVDAYVKGVDTWGGQLSTAYISQGPDNLHGPLASFHALGQSIPSTGPILDRLIAPHTQGRAQWWLVLTSGFVWNENQCPYIPAWTKLGGGGGVYIVESAAAIYEHGYLPLNHLALAKTLTYEGLCQNMKQANSVLKSTELKEWSADATAQVLQDPDRIKLRIARFLHICSLPNLGGFEQNPLEKDH